MKVLSLNDLIKAEAAFAMAYDIGNKHDEKSAILWRLIHTAREYHRLRVALIKCDELYADDGARYNLIRDALKESDGD